MKRNRGAPTTARPRAGVAAIHIVVASRLWTEQRSVKALLRRAIREAASATSTLMGEIAIVLTDDSAIRALNRHWRGKDAATNVLSFPAGEPRSTRGIPRLIAYETTEREARAEHKPFMNHLIHLAVHGFLHLAGHDHAADDQAAAMERLEAAILARLGVPDPYLARGAA
ncbi:MAG: rRNA maturation RNase YbeY [Alphaproteobacteria bacterium]|nr:MAG: rRNA maturation RNase YbeY [Alphaproteobacteria bacterium]